MRVELPGGLERYVQLNRVRLLAQHRRNMAACRPLNEGFTAGEVAFLAIAEWVSEANGFVRTLLAIIEDLSRLKSDDFYAASYLRYRLYLRSYFSEVGRARDRFGRLTKELQKIGVPINAREARENLERDLEHLLRGRNRALHEDLGKLRQEEEIESSLLGLPRLGHPEARLSNPEALLREAIDSFLEPLRKETERCVSALSRALSSVWIETEKLLIEPGAGNLS